MSAAWTLCRREWGSSFLVPAAYVTLFFFLGLMGLTFWFLAEPLSAGVTVMTVQRDFFHALLFFQLLVIPVLTMKTFAEERRSGTIETLLTAPVGDGAVVAGKFFGAWTQWLLMLALTSSYFFLLRVFDPLAAMDHRQLLTGYAGSALIGALFVAAGLFFSAMTRSQVVAAISTFTALFLLYLTGYVQEWTRHAATAAWATYCSPMAHLNDFSRGVLDTRALVFYVSFTLLLLFATVKRLEVRRWV